MVEKSNNPLFRITVGEENPVIIYNNIPEESSSDSYENDFQNTSTGRLGTIQSWTVPSTGDYRITAYGAQGATGGSSGTGGFGAKMSGVFSLTEGDVYSVLVGQRGLGDGTFMPAGGGGSFVVRQGGTTNDDILIIAGGGGGGAVGDTTTNQSVAHASITTSGKNAFGGSSAGAGGTSGNGGAGASSRGAGGGGFFTNGGNGTSSGSGGLAFVNGGDGGNGGSWSDGGFGSGGAVDASTIWGACGGGGGYSGGGGAYSSSSFAEGWGGGGGSFNSGSEQDNEAGENTGHGSVSIVLLGVVTSTENVYEVTDMVSGNVSISSSDALPTASLVFNNNEGKYNDVLFNGDTVKITFEYENEGVPFIEYDLEYYYDFNDDSDSGVLVDLEENFNGVISGATYTDEEAISGNSLYFDGGVDYVTLDNPEISKNDAFSVNFNVKPEGSGYYYYVVWSGGLYVRDGDGNDIDSAAPGGTIGLLDVSDNDEAYVHTSEGNLVKYTADSSGQLTQVYSEAMGFSTNILVPGALTRSGDSVHAYSRISDIPSIRKFNTSDGSLVWTHTTPTAFTVTYILCDSNDDVYYSTGDGHIRKISSTDGSLLWSVNHPTDDFYKMQFNSKEELFATTRDGFLYKISTGGDVLSSAKIGDDSAGIDIFDDDLLVVSYVETGGWDRIGLFSENLALLNSNALDPLLGFPHATVAVANDNTIYVSGASRVWRVTKDLQQISMFFASHAHLRVSQNLRGDVSKQCIFKRGTFFPLVGVDGNNIEFKLDASTTIEYERTSRLLDFVNVGFTYDSGWWSLFINGKIIDKRHLEIEEGSLTMVLGEEQGDYGFLNGYIDNFAFWNRAVTEEEHFIIANNGRNLERAEYSFVDIPNFVGKVESLDYQYDDSEGFKINVEAKSFPQLVDTTFTDMFINEPAYQAIDKILQTYRQYEDVVFSFWEENGWHTTTFANEVSTWNTEPKNFPRKAEQLVIATYQNERGWKAIKEICERAGLDVWVEYDDINNNWAIRTVRKGDYSLYPREIAHWRMNDEVFDIDPNTSFVISLNSNYINKTSNDFIYSIDLVDIPQNLKDKITDYDIFIFNGGDNPSKTNTTTSTFDVIDSIDTRTMAANSYIDMVGNLYVATTLGMFRYNFDRENMGDLVFNAITTLNIPGSYFSVAATKDGRFIYTGGGSGDYLFKKFDHFGNELFSLTPHTGAIRRIVVDSSGFVYTASHDNTVKKFTDMGNELWEFTGFSSEVMGLDVDDNGYVYAVDYSGVVKRIDSDGNEDWSNSSYTANDGYSLKLDSNNNVFVGFSVGRTVKLSSAGTQLFNINGLGNSAVTMDIDVDSDDNIYLMKWNNFVYKCNNTGTVLGSNQYSASTDQGWSIAVDKRTLRDFEFYNLDSPEEKYYKETETLDVSPLSGKVYFRINNIDSLNENRVVFAVKEHGIKNLKERETWSLDYNAVWHLEEFEKYGYDETVDSSQYDNILTDRSTHYTSGCFEDPTQYSHIGTSTTLVKTYYYKEDYDIKNISRIYFRLRSSNSNTTSRVLYNLRYADGTNTNVQYERSSLTGTDYRWWYVENPHPQKEVYEIRVSLRNGGGSSVTYIDNQIFYDTIKRPEDSLFLDTEFSLNSTTGRQSIIGAVERDFPWANNFWNIAEQKSFELYTDDDQLLLDLYQTHFFINYPEDDNSEVFRNNQEFGVMKTFDNLSFYADRITAQIRTNSSGNVVEARFKYYHYDETVSYSNLESTSSTTYQNRVFTNPNTSKRVIKIELEGRRVGGGSYSILSINARFQRMYPWGKHTFNIGTISSGNNSVIVNYDGSTIYSFINGVLSSQHSHTGPLYEGSGYALGAKGPSDATDIIDGEVTRAIIGRGLEPFLLETLLASRTVSDFYSFTHGDRLVDSTNNYNGTLDTNLATPIRGRIANGLRTNSDTSDYKVYTYVDNDEFQGNFNVSGWVRFPELSASEVSIVERDNWDIVKTDDNKIKFSIASEEVVSDTISENEWYFVSSQYAPNSSEGIEVLEYSLSNWSTTGTAGTTTLYGVDWSPELELFAAVGVSGAVRWSDDGKTWTTSGTAGSDTLIDVAYSPELELFSAVGASGAVRWSEDGKTWTTTGTAGSTQLNGVAWSSELGLFVAVGDSGAVRWSEDGKTWTTTGTAGSTTLFGVAYSPELGLFAAVGFSGAVRWSDDGETWTTSGTAGSAALTGVAWSPELELFVAVGENGAVRYSEDGENWTTTGSAGSTTLRGVAWSSELGLISAVGGSGNVRYNDCKVLLSSFISLKVSEQPLSYLDLDTSTISASSDDLVTFGKNGAVDLDDFRIIRGVLSDEEYWSLYVNGFGSESHVKDTRNDIIQSINLNSLSSSQLDSSSIYNRVIVYGETIGDNIISVGFDEDKNSVNRLWAKDRVVNTDSITDDRELAQFARTELNRNRRATLNANVTSVGLPFIKPTYNITVNIPNANLSGVYRVQEIQQSLSDEFTTDVVLSKRLDNFRDIFVNKINFDDFENPARNLNDMRYSYRVTFEEVPQIVSLVGVVIVDGDVRLASGATTGTITTSFVDVRDNVTECEFRRFENEFTGDDVYEVTNNGGSTWETIQRDRGLVHKFNSVGNRVGFRITMNRDSDTDPSPSYRAVVLLYK